jgi:hypothetical protein
MDNVPVGASCPHESTQDVERLEKMGPLGWLELVRRILGKENGSLTLLVLVLAMGMVGLCYLYHDTKVERQSLNEVLLKFTTVQAQQTEILRVMENRLSALEERVR